MLLSPAGSPESLKAAVNSGADAVYLGVKQFNARERAVNFTESEIAEAIDYCHLRGVEVYFAVNILYRNSEIEKVIELIRNMAQMGADAFIVQDIGLARIIKNMWPDIKLHASTQMTILTPDDARFLAQAGFSRAILGRELSLSQIKEITSLGIIETEVFIHGALCVCYSGQCLMSSKLGCRSGNRGQCAQPCRLPYTLTKDGNNVAEGYLLSTRDLITIDILYEIIETGVDCLKIEGRMKDAVYTAAVTSEYRQLLDTMKVNDGAGKRLNQVFNRGGSSDSGYFIKHAGRELMSTATPKNTGVLAGEVINYDARRERCTIKAYEPFLPGDGLEIWTQTEPHCGTGVNIRVHAGDTFSARIKGSIHEGDLVYKTSDKALEDSIKHEMAKESRKRVLAGRFYAKAGERAVMELQCNDIRIIAYSDIPQAAKTAETDINEIKSRLSKTGSSVFLIEWECFEVDKGLFFPVSILNGLRREALGLMESAIISNSRRALSVKQIPSLHLTPPNSSNRRIHVSIARTEQLEAALRSGANRIIIEQAAFDPKLNIVEKCHDYGAELFMALPLTCGSEPLREFNVDGYYARSWGQITALADTKRPIIADYTIQALNGYSISYILSFCQGITLSPELALWEAKDNACQGSEIIVYGRLPLMITRQCPVGNYAVDKRGKNGFGCSYQKGVEFALTDRKGYVFPIERDCENCNAIILNSVVTDLYKKLQEIQNIQASALRLMIYNESPDDIIAVIKKYSDIARVSV